VRVHVGIRREREPQFEFAGSLLRDLQDLEDDPIRRVRRGVGLQDMDWGLRCTRSADQAVRIFWVLDEASLDCCGDPSQLLSIA
jgi:hypothetical protein